jgi:hypothetical protein
MLTIFHHPKAKIFWGELSCEKKRRLPPCKKIFISFARKLANQKVFALG